MLKQSATPLTLTLLVAGASLARPAPALAQADAWCVVVTDKDAGYESCSYASFAQCRGAASGVGYCVANGAAQMPRGPVARRGGSHERW